MRNLHQHPILARLWAEACERAEASVRDGLSTTVSVGSVIDGDVPAAVVLSIGRTAVNDLVARLRQSTDEAVRSQTARVTIEDPNGTFANAKRAAVPPQHEELTTTAGPLADAERMARARVALERFAKVVGSVGVGKARTEKQRHVLDDVARAIGCLGQAEQFIRECPEAFA